MTKYSYILIFMYDILYFKLILFISFENKEKKTIVKYGNFRVFKKINMFAKA